MRLTMKPVKKPKATKKPARTRHRIPAHFDLLGTRDYLTNLGIKFFFPY